MPVLRHALAALLILGLFASASLAFAGEILQKTAYKITLSGLPIAEATINSAIEGEGYRIESRFKSAGLAHVITEMEAVTTSSGTFIEGRATPDNYVISFRRGKKTRTYDVAFRNGEAVSTTIEPKRRKLPKKWIELGPEDLKAVLDPVVALIRPGNEDPCPAKLPVYDGEMRFDLVLTPKADQAFSASGFNGMAKVCSVKFVPLSGYRAGRDDLEYVRKLEDIEIWFARSARINAYGPVHVSLSTRYGALKITAAHFDD